MRHGRGEKLLREVRVFEMVYLIITISHGYHLHIQMLLRRKEGLPVDALVVELVKVGHVVQ